MREEIILYGPYFYITSTGRKYTIHSIENDKTADFICSWYRLLDYLLQNANRSIPVQELTKKFQPWYKETISSYYSRMQKKAFDKIDERISPLFDNKKNDSYRINLKNGDYSPASEVKFAIIEKLFPGNARLETLNSPSDIISSERSSLLEKIKKSTEGLIVLVGPPLAGKTTFIKAFVNHYNENVLSSFWGRYDDERKKDGIYMLKDIACQLASKCKVESGSYLHHLWCTLNNVSTEDIQKKTFNEMFDLLLVKPFKRMHSDLSGFIVIDALDEINTGKEFIKNLEILLPHIADKNIKFLISSRDSFIESPKIDNIRVIHLDGDKDLTNSLCKSLFLRLFPQGEYADDVYNLLSVLTALRTSISENLLSQILGENNISTLHKQTSRFIDLLDKEEYPRRVKFNHMSVRDWLQNIDQSGEYFISTENGMKIIFNYIYRQWKNGEDIPYPILQDWEYYARMAHSPKKYKEIQNDETFLLEAISQFRRHGDFSGALSLIDENLKYCSKGSEEWLRFTLYLQDIRIDLDDLIEVEKDLSLLLGKYTTVLNNNPRLKVHLLEDHAWCLMEKGELDEAQNKYNEVIRLCGELPIQQRNELLPHALYLYSVLLYRRKNFDEGMDKITEAIRRMERIEDAKQSLDYSLMLKMQAWFEQKLEKIHDAEVHLKEALKVQKAFSSEQDALIIEDERIPINHYLAHTYLSLAELDLELAKDDTTGLYRRKGLENIHIAIEIFNKYIGQPNNPANRQDGNWSDFRFLNRLENCKRVEEELNNLSIQG